MPAFCGIMNCGNRSDRDKKSFFRLPAVLSRGDDEKKKLSAVRRKKWLLAIKRSDMTEDKMKWLRICEDHFVTGKPAELQETTHPDWVPSRKLGHGSDPNSSVLSRFLRTEARSSPSVVATVSNTCDVPLASAVDDESEVVVEDVVTNLIADTAHDFSSQVCCLDVGMCTSTQTDFTGVDIMYLQKSLETTTKRLEEAEARLEKISLSEETFKNDEKAKYYSGLLNFNVLMIIFSTVSKYINVTPLSTLSKFQQFMLTMMHLRLNLDFKDLSYRFGVSTSTASRVFHNVLFIMHERLSSFLFWPERSALQEKVPECFLQAFGCKVTIIIDCFEIFMQKPPNVRAAGQTYSHYKHHNTVKYLIGITPQGCISFLSAGWGGRTSDKCVVNNCGILEKLLPGDLILADRGFTVQDEVQLYCAEIKVPAFTKGKKQLSPLEVEKTRELAHVRIHVERVIGVLRQKYRILHNVMPITLVKKSSVNGLSVLDMIVTVCCCLTNVSPSVIPFD